jgi:hypothetical protein
MGRPPNKHEETTAVPDVLTDVAVVQEPVNTSVAPLTTDALLSLIASMSQQLLASQNAAKESNEKLAAAILETTKPREALKSKEQIARESNDKLFDEKAKELKRRQRENEKYGQELCDHVAGCSALSEQRDIAGRLSIIWHRNDVGVDVGVCTNCGRIFRPTDPADAQQHTYQYWRKKPSFNKLSAAGHRTMLNPQKAMEESYLHDTD